jgi:stage V sporulation protein G
VIQTAVIKAFQEEKERAKQPGYVCTYDDLDGDADEAYPQIIGDLGGARNHGEYRPHTAHGPRGSHRHASGHDAPRTVASREDNRPDSFGAGIL